MKLLRKVYNAPCIRKLITWKENGDHLLRPRYLTKFGLAEGHHFSTFKQQTIPLNTELQHSWSSASLSSHSGVMGDSVHTTAKTGFQEGTFYDQHRPSYADEAIERVAQSLYKDPEQEVKYNIVELGAGTGKFTSKMLKKLGKGYTYLATEPSDGFLGTLKDNNPGVETAICAATDIPLPDNSVQNFICAQSFHWFATKESLAEMTRVLVPNGRVLMVWNNKDLEVSWANDMENILTDYYGDSPRAISRQWLKVIEAFSPLTSLQHIFLPGISGIKGDKNFILDHYSSVSVISSLEPAQRETARARFRDVLDRQFPTDEEITIPFKSEFYSAEKH